MGKARILIVDDEPQVCDLISDFLADEGYHCSSAYSGEEAIGILETEDYDLVITDVTMSGMSGLDLLVVVKRLLPWLPVLVVTGVDDEKTGILAMELGAFAYIVKPVSLSKLVINVSSALVQSDRNESNVKRVTLTEHEDQSSQPVGQHRRVSAEEILLCLQSGMSDLDLMERFSLSSESLLDLLSTLGSLGKADRKKLNERASLATQTVALDILTNEKKSDKPTIAAAEAVECIRSGMDDVALMKRFGISARGLNSLFRKLLDAGLLTSSEFYGRPRPDHEFVLDMRNMRRRHLAVTTRIWEADRPGQKGWLLNVTERGLGTTGLDAEVGETKELVVDSQLLGGSAIRAKTRCIWAEKGEPDGQMTAGFQIIEIEEECLAELKELVKVLSLEE